MKIIQYFTMALTIAAIAVSQGASAEDSCETVLCLWGKLQGSERGGCSSAEDDYFSIIVRKHGKIKWSETSNARQQYLDSCSEADQDKTKEINNVYGKSWG